MQLWALQNITGSASLATTVTGTLLSQRRYLPYGETRWSSGPFPTDRRFTGQREEVTLGVYDYGARMYDVSLGRFISADSIVPEAGQPQSLNRYMYVLGNPLRYIDPTGHLSEEQLNQLGYYRDKMSESTWYFLLTLQPEDWMVVYHSNPDGDGYKSVAGKLGITQRRSEPGQPPQYGLFVFGKWGDSEGKVTELLEWVGEDINNVSVTRDTPDGPEMVWEDGGPTSPWSMPLRQSGRVQTELGATQARQFGDLTRTLLQIPLALSLVFFDATIAPGELAGDEHMTFTYYDTVNERYYTRSMWMRSEPGTNRLLMISDTWFENVQ